MKHTTAQFDFVAKPKVTAVKQKYREEVRLDGTNLMNDPRVVRGNTYAAIVQNKNQIVPPQKKTVKQGPKKRQRKINFDTGFDTSTPHPIEGRQHFTMQTEPFVEMLRDKPIQYQKEAQTDLFLDRPVQRQFDPFKSKTGVDRVTQIQQNDPELFDFNYEVQPIVDALLSKVVETSRMELHEEELMKEKQKEKLQYERKRHAKLAQAQKLEANQLRLKQQNDRRNLQYRKVKQQESATQKKVVGRILSKQYLKNLKPNTYMILENEGFFRDPLESDLHSEYGPWLYETVLNELHLDNQYSQSVESLVREAEKDVAKESQKSINIENQRRAKIQKEKQDKIEEKRLRKQEKIRMKEQEERLQKERIQAEEKQKEKAQEGEPPAA